MHYLKEKRSKNLPGILMALFDIFMVNEENDVKKIVIGCNGRLKFFMKVF